MIDKKIILYAVFGMIAFALWEAWQKDYGKPTAMEQPEPKAAASLQSPEIITKPAKKTGVSAPAAQGKQFDIPESRVVKVHTDVLEIEIDKQGGNIVRVGLLDYPAEIDSTKPITLLDHNQDKYYVAQSGLLGEMGPDSINGQAEYSVDKNSYSFVSGEENLEVKLKWFHNGVTVNKIFSFAKGKYDVGVDYVIDNKSGKDWVGQYYAKIKRKAFEPKKGLFQFSTYTGAAISSKEKPYEKISFSDMESAAKKQKTYLRDSEGGWIAMQQRYFLSAWVPPQNDSYRYFSSVGDEIYTIGLNSGEMKVAAGEKDKISSVLYVGPEISENIAPLAPGLDLTVDYGWLWILSTAFFWLLKKIYDVVGNWGWAIVVITILIKLLFYKLSESSCCSMARMREVMPKVQALKERYGDDKQKLHQATMDLYKREKINPLNLGGCLPMLVQIPFFIALYYVLIGAVELRHAPFIFWIQDLSVRDPYYILPVLMGLSMFLQQKLTPSSADPTQAKIMMLMPVMFTFFFLNFPSGLVLYWFASNLLSMLQQWYINKKLKTNPKVCDKR